MVTVQHWGGPGVKGQGRVTATFEWSANVRVIRVVHPAPTPPSGRPIVGFRHQITEQTFAEAKIYLSICLEC